MKDRKIEVILAKDNENYTLKINGFFLHSSYNPIKEAATFAKNNIEKINRRDFVIVYGVGLGYHIREILKILDKNAVLYVFDLDEEVFNLAQQYGCINDILKDQRLKLYIGNNEIFYSKFKEMLGIVEDLIVYEPSVRLLSDKYADFREILVNFILGKIAVEKFGEIAQLNVEKNLKQDFKLIEEFLEVCRKDYKPVVLVAAGPSLDDALGYLKQVRDKVKIFAVGSALKNLLKNEIVPDMFCIIDPQEIVYEQIKGLETLNVPMCFLASASSKAVENYLGPKYIFFNDVNEYGSVVVETGKSVSTAVLSIAILSGAKNIFFVGLDLAFVNNKFHCNNYPHRDKINNSIYMKVEGVSGDLVSTTRGMYYFKTWIEKKISKHADINFINLSKGARINGSQILDIINLPDYLDKMQM